MDTIASKDIVKLSERIVLNLHHYSDIQMFDSVHDFIHGTSDLSDDQNTIFESRDAASLLFLGTHYLSKTKEHADVRGESIAVFEPRNIAGLRRVKTRFLS